MLFAAAMAFAVARPVAAQTLPPAPMAQAPVRDARLTLTATDQTGAVLPGATVTITGTDAKTQLAGPLVLQTNNQGIANADSLAAGAYTVRVEMDGFNPTLMPDLKIVRGDNKRTMTMAIKTMSDSVTVQVDKQAAATDRNMTFGSALTREQIDALPDDPAELEKALREMAGPDAVFRVDSFEGGRLPDKSQIKAIHISRDQFAAENHSAGGITIDIVTQAGSGPFRMNGGYNLRDSALDGKNEKIAGRAPTRSQNYNFGTGGTIIPNKLSANFSGGVSRQFQAPLFYYNNPDGTLVSRASDVRATNNGHNLFGDMTYALTKDQTMRVGVSQFTNESRYLGVGGYSQLERAYTNKNNSIQIRAQEAGPLGRRFVTNTKFSFIYSKAESVSASDAVALVVNDAFTVGGAQQRGGRTTKEFMLQSDLDYVRGIHTVRTGVTLQGGSYHSDAASNYNGTYTFESLAAYNAGKPRSFTRRIGDPLIDFNNLQAGWYIQDDIRVSKSLSLSPGVRYEVQTHLRDYNAISPRFGFTWSPFKSGKTSLRGSWGIFHDWLQTTIYEQSLRVDGFRQQEITIANPSYPNAGAAGVIGASTKYLIDPELAMSRSQRVSAGIDQTFTPRMRASVTYAYSRLEQAFRGENLNTPVNGVRPDQNFANVIRVVADGSARQHSLNANLNWQFAASSPQLQAARFNIRRGSLSFNYSTGRVLNNYDGSFQTPASGNIANEWGYGFNDVRHRFNVGINSSALKNANLSVNFNRSGGTPYNITTGLDNNGDLIFNDRPAGYARNAGRGDAQWNLSAFFNYGITFGKSRTGPSAPPPGIMVMAMNGGPVAVSTMAAPPGRYRLSLSVNANNLLNHANQFGYVGNMLSQNFGQATQVAGVRQFSFNMNFGF